MLVSSEQGIGFGISANTQIPTYSHRHVHIFRGFRIKINQNYSGASSKLLGGLAVMSTCLSENSQGLPCKCERACTAPFDVQLMSMINTGANSYSKIALIR